MFVTNGQRAMVALMEHAGDAGRHLGDPSASGSSGGYLLDNGQVDDYADRDTVELASGLDAVRALVDGSGLSGLTWVDDG